MNINDFSGIRSMALEIAYDNGMINRDNSQEDFLTGAQDILSADGYDDADLRMIDSYLKTFSTQQMQILAAGEETETADLLRSHRAGEAHKKRVGQDSLLMVDAIQGMMLDIFEG